MLPPVNYVHRGVLVCGVTKETHLLLAWVIGTVPLGAVRGEPGDGHAADFLYRDECLRRTYLDSCIYLFIYISI